MIGGNPENTAFRAVCKPGLQPSQFKRIAERGIGDPSNSYPHAMAWYNDHLYVGTTRCILTLLFNRHQALRDWPVTPVTPATKNPYEEFDVRGQIWRYHPPRSRWEKVLTSPLIRNADGVNIPIYYGMRNMVVFQRRTDSRPALYCLTWSPQGGPGARLLVSEDGQHFQPYEIRIEDMQTNEFASFRPVATFRDRLYTAPSSKSGAANRAGIVAILENDDPLSKPWRQVNPTNFGDPHNDSTAELIVFNDHLYAGTSNPDGFQLWKTDAAGVPPYRWQKVLSRGAGRGPTNKGAASLCAFNDALYIGTAISNGGYCRTYGIGPAACEVLRVYPDDTWDLIVGNGRLTDQGLKMPLSGFGPGFDQPTNTYLWRFCVHDGWLYAGTFAAISLLPYLPRKKWPEHRKRMMDDERTELVMNKLAGFDLWRTRDGVYWTPITRNGFDNPFNWGVRSMVSSPYGLFLGVANPFGPAVAVKRSTGWRYEPHPRGGLEIWLGSESWAGTALGQGREKQPGSRPLPEYTPETAELQVEDSVLWEFYEGTSFRMFGYWKATMRSTRAACENLVTELLSFQSAPPGRVLILGSDAGATGEFLARRFPEAQVTCLRFEKPRGHREAPSPDAPPTVYAPSPSSARTLEQYDAIVNVESLSASDHAAGWLRLVHEHLKPGGMFLGAEVLSDKKPGLWKKARGRHKLFAGPPQELAEKLSHFGFEDVQVVDATRSCWEIFRQRLDLFLREKRMDGELDEEMEEAIKETLFGAYAPVSAYVLVHARKSVHNRP